MKNEFTVISTKFFPWSAETGDENATHIWMVDRHPYGNPALVYRFVISDQKWWDPLIDLVGKVVCVDSRKVYPAWNGELQVFGRLESVQHAGYALGRYTCPAGRWYGPVHAGQA